MLFATVLYFVGRQLAEDPGERRMELVVGVDVGCGAQQLRPLLAQRRREVRLGGVGLAPLRRPRRENVPGGGAIWRTCPSRSAMPRNSRA